MLVAGTILLFRGGPDYDSSRSFRQLWDSGHIIYFALAAWMLSRWRPVACRAPVIQWVVILCITLVAGTLIELAQDSVQRSPEISDVLRDLTGSVLILAFGPACATVGSRRWKLLLKGAAVCILLAQLWPLASSMLDEANARADFPVLADFEAPFEISRWNGGEGLSVEQLSTVHGGKALRVPLSTEHYSGADLLYFEGDWRKFHTLKISAFNPDAQPLWVTVRIHDRQHAQGLQQYEDRFNQHVLLVHGWNHIGIDLNEVASAPAQRRMDMGHVRGLGIFATSLQAPRFIYLDNVRLE